ncbi:28 kDa ribonucleoprotein, chloroplastic isoform X1 [Magnolia sinica]|uniref:28 kDa ribonucleoprotein, chloroplastic isoform X1 n=1 Tax=Magnolia sinica TaxID=86752 RepID=UPI002658973A|nr:28 kDa ribonucleoprotein, chloroplastic isoform X1 [Magnolia sinica]
MALLLSGIPSTFSRRQKQQLFTLPKRPQIKLPLSISTISHIPKIPLLFHIAAATQQQHSSPSSTSTVENPTSESQLQQQQQQQGQEQESNPNRTRLIAQNVPWTSTSDDIRALFEKYGTVVDVELSMYNKTKNRGLAFVEMASEEEALAAISNLDSYEFEGRVIKVEFARTVKKKPSSVMIDPVKKFNVFVGNLAWRVRSSDLREFFGAENGSAVAAEVVFQSNPRRSAGYGFVSFRSKEEADAAIAAFNGKALMGRTVRLGLTKNDVSGNEGDSKGGETVEANYDEGLSNQADDEDEEATKEAE